MHNEKTLPTSFPFDPTAKLPKSLKEDGMMSFLHNSSLSAARYENNAGFRSCLLFWCELLQMKSVWVDGKILDKWEVL